MKTIIKTLKVLVYIIYAAGVYFFIIKEDYKLSSIFLMFSVFLLSVSYDVFKDYLIEKLMKTPKDKAMIKMLNDYQEENKLPKCTCHDVNQCDTWCVGKENYTKASRHGIE